MFDLSKHIAKPGEALPNWAQKVLAMPDIARLMDTWATAKGSKALPSPQDLPPEKLVFCMPRITVTEFISPEHIRYRLVGTDATSRLGFDLTDKNMFDYTPRKYHVLLNDIYSIILTMPAAVLSISSNTLSSGVQREVNALHLPMINHDGETNRLLNLHLPKEPIAYQAPRDVVEIGSEITDLLILPL